MSSSWSIRRVLDGDQGQQEEKVIRCDLTDSPAASNLPGKALYHALFPGEQQEDAPEEHGETRDKAEAEGTLASAVFSDGVTACFELMAEHIVASSLENKENDEARPPRVLFLTADDPSQLRAQIKNDATRWSDLLTYARSQTASPLSLIDQIDIRCVPTPKHLFACLALMKESMPATRDLPALFKSRLVFISKGAQGTPAKSANTKSDQGQAHEAKVGIQAGAAQTILVAAPSLVVLHGASKWLSQQPGGSLASLVSAISHTLSFCETVALASQADALETEPVPVPLIWFESPQGEQAAELQSVLDAIAERYFDTIAKYIAGTQNNM